MRCALALALLAGCDTAPSVGPVRVTAYGRGDYDRGVLASGAEIRSYDAAVDADHGKNTFATATTDANGVAMLDVPAGGYIVYEWGTYFESIQAVEPGDDLIVGDSAAAPVTADVEQTAQLPFVATRFMGLVASAHGDLWIMAQYLVDAPPGAELSLSFLPVDLPPVASDPGRYNAYVGYGISDRQYDDYDDFRNQRRHEDREAERTVVKTTIATYGWYGCFDYQCWSTSR